MPIETPYGVAVLDPNVTAKGIDQAGATQLSALTSIVASSTAGSGVKILAAANYTQIVANTSANDINVYPPANMSISPGSTNAPVILSAGRAYGIIVASTNKAHIVFNTSSFG